MLHFIFSLIVGAIIGAIAAKLMGFRSSLLVNILLGVLGGFVGDFLFSLIGVYTTGIGNVITSVVGACIVIWVGNRIFGHR